MTENMRKISPFFVLLVTIVVLTINYNWGLPSEKRVELLFGDKEKLKLKIPELLQTKKRFEKPRDSRTVYHSWKDEKMSHSDLVNKGFMEFLLIPYAGDERFVLKSISNLNPYKLQFDPKHYVYGGGFIYTAAVFLQSASWLSLVNIFPEERYYMANPGEMGKIMTVLRLMVVLFAALGISFFYFISRKYFNEKSAFLAWAIILICPLTVQLSHTVEPHIFVVPFFLLSMYFCMKSLTSNIIKSYIYAAIFAGLTIGTQATSIYIVFPFFVSLISNYHNKRITFKDITHYLLIYILLSLLAFFFINPYYLINYKGFISELRLGGGRTVFSDFRFWAPYQTSWFLVILFIFATIYYLFKKRTRYTNILLAAIIPGIFVYVITHYFMSYIYSIIPLLALLSAMMLIDLYNKLTGKMKVGFVVVTVVLFLISPGARSVYYFRNFTAENRYSAGAWINEHAPPGSKVGIFFPPTVWDCVPFKFKNYKLIDYREIDFNRNDQLPDVIFYMDNILPDLLKKKYRLSKEYYPKKIFGHDFELVGDLHALIAKPLRIYLKNI